MFHLPTTGSRRLRTTVLALGIGALALTACAGEEAAQKFEDVGYACDGMAPTGDRPTELACGDLGEDDGGGGSNTFAEVGNAIESGGGAPLPAPTPGTAAPPPQIPIDEANQFDATGINPWTETSTDAQSTFALDVDTGSYTIARRFLDEGQLPPADAIRVEEIVNYLDYGYQDPGTHDLTIDVAGTSSPFTSEEEDTRLVRVGVQSRRLDDDERKDASLTFVVDTSGSMDLENRLGLVRRSLARLVGELRPSDTIAIVEYGSDARVVLTPTPVSDSVTILAAIDQLVPTGSTNAEAGLRLGYEQARAALREGGINRVVLASDGVANVGTSDPNGLVQQLRDDADAGIHLVTVGFGMGNYNDTLMEQLADQGDGFYAYVDTDEEAERLFTDELTATLQTLALDAKSQVVFDPSVVTEYRLLGYENRDIADQDFRNDAVDAGEIGAGHAVTALYEVRLAPGVAAGSTVATAFLRWEDPDSGEVTEIERSLAVDEIAPSFTDAPSTVQRAAVSAYYAEVLRASPPVIERGITMDEVSQAAQSVLATHGGDGHFGELATLVATAAARTP